MLAYGSNQSPEVLRHKYKSIENNWIIPVTRCSVDSLDVVFAAYITPYGAVPATLQVSHGTRISVFVTWLNEEQLAVMHCTERQGEVYDFGILRGAQIQLEGGYQLPFVFCYMNRHGALNLDGTPLRIRSIDCIRGILPPSDEAEVLDRLRQRFDPERQIDEFINMLIESADYRAQLQAQIARDAFRSHGLLEL